MPQIMEGTRFLQLIVLSFGILVCICDGKKSVKDLSSPFRLSKHNLLWERAKKSMGGSPKMETLHTELKKLDKLSLTLKHLEDQESEEAKQMAVDTKEMFLDIMNRYGLMTNKVGNEQQQHIKPKFSDELEKLWQEAVYSGKFSSDELDSLEEEFKHHGKKVEDYRKLVDKIIDHDSISENDIRVLDKLSHDEMKQLKMDLKFRHHNLSVQFLDLKRKVKDRALDVEGDFTDERVVELWDSARKSGFSQKELESIKEELKHFQIRIDKHNYWKERQQKMGQELNEGQLPEPLDHEQVISKVKEHGKIVKKYHATMLDRIHRKDEL